MRVSSARQVDCQGTIYSSMCALCAIRPAKMIITAKITAHEVVAGDKRLFFPRIA
jgi:hypothetical protein